MEKLSIKEKAKAYDKAIESLRAAFYDGEEYRDACKRLIEPIFPELKESEDEKVRRELIKLLQECYDIDSGFFTRYCKVPFAQMLAWLEKRGEKGTNGNEREIPNSEQKPAWSEEDESFYNYLLGELNASLIDFCGASLEDITKAIGWFKSLKERVHPQAKHEWSEGDERKITYLDDLVGYQSCISKDEKKEFHDWLKSIKDRYTWRPSDEYIRTDAFVEKAFDAYCKVCGHYAHKTPTHICRQNCDYFENFKRYIKGE